MDKIGPLVLADSKKCGIIRTNRLKNIKNGVKMSEIRDNYRKSDIRLSLINELRARSMTKKDIQDFLSSEYKRLGKVPVNCEKTDNYKVSDRTVTRMINSIKDSYGKQLEINEEFGTYKLDLYDFPDTIEETEIQALDIALQKMGNNKNAKTLLESLKSKLTARLYRKIKNIEPLKADRKINDIDQKINANYAFVGPRLIVKFDENVKSVLDFAINNQHEVRFKYYNKETTVCPLGIIDGPNNVYLIAYECKKSQFCGVPRHYILSEISNISDTQNWFARDNKFSIKEYADSMFGIYNDGTIYDVEWLIKKPKTIGIAKKYLFHPSQQFIDNPDGSLIIKMRTGGLQAMSSFLATWNGDIVPTKPKELIDNYEKLLKNCLDSIKK